MTSTYSSLLAYHGWTAVSKKETKCTFAIVLTKVATEPPLVPFTDEDFIFIFESDISEHGMMRVMTRYFPPTDNLKILKHYVKSVRISENIYNSDSGDLELRELPEDRANALHAALITKFQKLTPQTRVRSYDEDVSNERRQEVLSDYRDNNAPQAKRTFRDELEAEVDSYFEANLDVDTETRGVYLVENTNLYHDTKKRDHQQLLAPYRDIIERQTPLFTPNNLEEVRTKVLKKYPYATEVFDRIMAKTYRLHSIGQPRLQINPTLLWGDAGAGKTSFLRYMFKELGAYYRQINLGGAADDHWSGVSKGFATAMPSVILESIKRSGTANPVMIIDELDKIPTTAHNNTLSKLLSVLEPDEAKKWHEIYLGSSIDVSHVSYLFTANQITDAHIPLPLKSRLEVIKMPLAQADHVPVLVSNIIEQIASEEMINPRFMSGVTVEQMDAMKEAWDECPNLRILKRQVQYCIRENENALCSMAQ